VYEYKSEKIKIEERLTTSVFTLNFFLRNNKKHKTAIVTVEMTMAVLNDKL